MRDGSRTRVQWRNRREENNGRQHSSKPCSKHNENKQLLKQRNDHQNVKLKAILNQQTMQ